MPVRATRRPMPSGTGGDLEAGVAAQLAYFHLGHLRIKQGVLKSLVFDGRGRSYLPLRKGPASPCGFICGLMWEVTLRGLGLGPPEGSARALGRRRTNGGQVERERERDGVVLKQAQQPRKVLLVWASLSLSQDAQKLSVR